MKTSLLVLMALAAPLAANADPLITDNNLLAGQASVPANVVYTTGSGTANSGGIQLTDRSIGTGGFTFDQDYGDTDGSTAFDQKIGITLPSSTTLTTIRIWSAYDIPPSEVTIYGSTSTSPSVSTAGDTVLASSTSLGAGGLIHPAGDSVFGYYQFTISSTSAFSSLVFDFGTQNATGAGGNTYDFTRITELQAFGPTVTVPEPSTYAMLGCGLVGLVAMLRLRKLS